MLVKALDEIPFDGELVPSGDTFKLVKDRSSDFSKLVKFKIKERLESKLQRKLALEKKEDMDLLEEEMQPYYPYVKANSSLNIFTINGIADVDCDKKIAVIDPISEHTRSTYVNINITGTAIQGPIRFSDSSILLIDEILYKSLPYDMKDNLISDYRIEKFNGSLKDALKNILKRVNAPFVEIDNLENNSKVDMIKFQLEAMANEKEVSAKKYDDLLKSDPERIWITDMLSAVTIQEDALEEKKVCNQYLKHLYLALMEEAKQNGLTLSVEEEYALHIINYNAYATLAKVLDYLTTSDDGLEKLKKFVAEYNKYARGTKQAFNNVDSYILERTKPENE